jgi:FKBP-type peptidyl-prolyl cis-trans isomerase SlyD
MNMLVARNTVVTLDYHVTDPDGEVVDEGREPLVYLHGGYDDIFRRSRRPCRARRSVSRSMSSCSRMRLLATTMLKWSRSSRRKDFPKELQVGMQFEGGPEEGDDDDFVIYRVTDIADDKVVLDGNHPLAGIGSGVYLYGDGGSRG